MSRTVVATDNFNRASLGANWEQVNPIAAVAQIVGSTAFAGSVFGQEGTARWIGAGTFTADQCSSVVIFDTPTGSNNYGIGAVVRASGDIDGARDYYLALVADTTYLLKIVNGSLSVLNIGSVTWTNGDRLEIEAEGTTIRLCQNGSPLGGAWTVTDTSLASGQPGICGVGDPGICTGDDWIGYNLVTADTFLGQACL
jgi:hypothetical protein